MNNLGKRLKKGRQTFCERNTKYFRGHPRTSLAPGIQQPLHATDLLQTITVKLCVCVCVLCMQLINGLLHCRYACNNTDQFDQNGGKKIYPTSDSPKWGSRARLSTKGHFPIGIANPKRSYIPNAGK